MRLSIPTKIFLGYTLVLGLFALVLVLNLTRLGKLYEEVTVINRGLVPLRLTVSELEGDLQSYLVLLAERDPVVLRSAVFASQVLYPFPRRIEERLNLCRSAIDQLLAKDLAPRQRDLLARLHRVVEALGEHDTVLFTQSDELSVAISGQDAERIETVRQRASDTLVWMRGQATTLSRMTDSIMVDTLDWASQQQRRNVLMVVVSTAGAMVVALMVMLWSAYSLRPLTTLSDGVRAAREGTFETIEVSAKNEIGALAAEFNTMVQALKERDERLEAAHQLAIKAEQLATIGKLTSHITHEIRNPLSSIALNIELLEDEIRSGLDDPSAALAIMASVTREVDRLTDITQEYLSFARLPVPKKQSEDLNELVKQVVAFHQEEMRQKSVEVQLSVEMELPLVRIDAGQIRQALLNLMKNAIEAMPEGGRLYLATRHFEGDVELAVGDEGCGIPDEVAQRLFEPFFTTKARGTGLGLALVRQIAVQHGGNIAYRPRLPSGTEFAIRIPAELDASAAPHAAQVVESGRPPC